MESFATFEAAYPRRDPMAETFGTFFALLRLAETVGPRVHSGPDPNDNPDASRMERELALDGRFPALEDGWK